MLIIAFEQIPDAEVLEYIRAHGGRVLVPEEQIPRWLGKRGRPVIRLNTQASVRKTIQRLMSHVALEIHIRGHKDTHPRILLVKDGSRVRVAKSDGENPIFKVREYKIDEYLDYLRSRLQHHPYAGLSQDALDETGAQEIQGIDEICRFLDILPESL